MKKLLSCLLVFCMLFSLGIYNTYVTTTQIKANDINVEIINEPLEGEEFNHVFTQKELKGTGYEGKNVKIVNGKDAKEITVYLKPEDHKAYFVAAGEAKEMDVGNDGFNIVLLDSLSSADFRYSGRS